MPQFFLSAIAKFDCACGSFEVVAAANARCVFVRAAIVIPYGSHMYPINLHAEARYGCWQAFLVGSGAFGAGEHPLRHKADVPECLP